MFILLQIALGGALGAVLRYLTVAQATVVFGVAFPFGTLIVNTVGALVMGAIAGVVMLRPDGLLAGAAPLVMTGILGGFTTFSAFSLDTVGLIEKGAVLPAMIYVAASVGLSVLALAAGLVLARAVLA